MIDTSATVNEFLKATAARTPTPGGGAVTALVGALAAAIGEMVVNYSVGKADLAEHQPKLLQAQHALAKAAQLLQALLVEDQAAYEELRAAKKLVNGSEKSSAVALAIEHCVGVPQAICATAISILDIVAENVETVNRYLLSDFAICADLSMAATRCAVYSVRVNLPGMPDKDEARRIDAVVSQMLLRAAVTIQRTSPQIWERVAKGV